jgi:predicted dehydrogenase
MASRVAIVGLGMAVTPHAKSLLDLKDRASVAYAYSPTRERRAKFAESFDFPLTDRLDIIAADPTLDAVLILTPPNTHLGLVERFAATGKHILLEKPLEITLERSERLVAAAGNVTLGVVLQHRFRPAAAKLHDIVESGRLGKLVSASASIPNWRPQSYYDQPGRGTKARDGGGVLLTQGIHTLDLLCWYAGEATDARSLWTTTSVHRMETEDLACAALRFSSGALGTVHATTTAYPGFPERIELIGRKGTALLEGTSLRAQFMDGTSEELKSDAGGGGTGADPMAFPHDWHRELLVDFLDAIEKRRAPRSSGAETLKVHRLIDRILRSGD